MTDRIQDNYIKINKKFCECDRMKIDLFLGGLYAASIERSKRNYIFFWICCGYFGEYKLCIRKDIIHNKKVKEFLLEYLI